MATHPTQYAHPEALVETDWLEKHLKDDGIRIVESNEDILLYDTGHIPGAVHIDWRADLQDPVDSLSFKTPIYDPTQMKQAAIDPNWMTKTGGPMIHVDDMPRRAVAEIVVVGTTPATSTGMIVFAMEPLLVGDKVELDPQ